MPKRTIKIENDFGDEITIERKNDIKQRKTINIKNENGDFKTIECGDDGDIHEHETNIMPIDTHEHDENDIDFYVNHNCEERDKRGTCNSCDCDGFCVATNSDTTKGYADAYLNEENDDVDEYENLVDVLDADGYELLDEYEDLVDVIDDEDLVDVIDDEDDVDFISDYKPLDARKHRPSLVDNPINEIDVSHDDIRAFNIGASDYSKHRIQPWDIWEEYNLNPWEADIVKRVLRKKNEGGLTNVESRIMDFEKIIHVARKCIEMLSKGTMK